MLRLSGWPSRFLAFAGILSVVACAPSSRFKTENAAEHVRVLAGDIGSRPSGTAANRRARDYIIDCARRAGFDVRVQEADGMRPLYGASAHVSNVIATRAGRQPYAVALVTHYDSVPDGAGAADDALGVAVCLEAGRVLAARTKPNYALALIFTDGEEFGLMGASALLKDPIVGWIRAVLNFESIGASGPALLFEAAPGSGAVLDAWRRASWRPAGSAFMTEIYRHLPADTDLTLLKRAGLAGVNFAPAGDSYAYHTSRDSVQRLDPFTLRHMGENAIAAAEALDALDLSTRKQTPSAYFDVARTRVFAYGSSGSAVILAVALLLGLFAWIQAIAVGRAVVGFGRVALTAFWSLVTTAATVAAMLGATWLLRATRESYHPWYAHPGRFYLFEVLTAALAAWLIVHIGRWLPARMRGSLEPAVLWLLIIPTWAALAIALQLFAPSAAYFAVLPLIAAAGGIVAASLGRAASLAIGLFVLAVTAVLWIPDAVLLLQFVVALLGRVPLVTPLVVYPVLLLVCGVFVVPPIATLILPLHALVEGRDSWRLARAYCNAGMLLVAGVVLSGAWCWMSPAYTDERPLQKTIRYVNDLGAGRTYWEVGSNEPGTDVARAAPTAGAWESDAVRFRYGTPLDQLRWPFAYRVSASVAEPAPVSVEAVLDCDATTCTAGIRAVPAAEGLVVIFTLPPGIVPDETNLPGVVENGQYRAIYAALPATGVTWRMRVPREDGSRLSGARVVVEQSGLPGASWPRLPEWVPSGHVVWRARSFFAVPVVFKAGAARVENGTIK